MRTEQTVIDELVELEAKLQQKLTNVQTAIRVLYNLNTGHSKTIDKPPFVHEPGEFEKKILATPPPVKHILNEKVCEQCHKTYQPTSNVQKRCEECRSKKVSANHKPAD